VHYVRNKFKPIKPETENNITSCSFTVPLELNPFEFLRRFLGEFRRENGEKTKGITLRKRRRNSKVFEGIRRFLGEFRRENGESF
jgi:hypothetical protein